MKALLNRLTEIICIIDKEATILFCNQAFLKNLCKSEQEVIGKKIDEYINFSRNPFFCGQSQYIESVSEEKTINRGEAFCYEETWEQSKAYYILLEFSQDETRKSKLLEQMVDAMVPQIAINDLAGKYVYANRKHGKYIGKDPKTLVGETMQDVLSEGYYAICSKEDEYVMKQDSLCVTTEWLEEEGMKKNYRILRIPLKADGKQIDHIGYMIYDNTCTTQIEAKVFEVIKQFETVELMEQGVSGENDTQPFRALKEVLKQYMETTHLNIWSYDKSIECLIPYFHENELERYIKDRSYLNFKKDKVEKRMREQASPVYVLEEVIPYKELLNHFKQRGYCYVVVHPIFYREEFIGIITSFYPSTPPYTVIKNDSIAGICNRIGVIIHEQKVAQKLRNEWIRRREAERELQGFLDISANIMGKIDENRRFVRINKGVESALGWTPEEFLEQNWDAYTHPKDIEYLKVNKFGEGIAGNIQSRYKHKNGQYKWFQWYWKYSQQSQEGYFTAKDITEYKRWEQHQKKMEEVLQLEEVRKEFFANVSHELRTPLAILMGVHQLIEEQISPHHYEMIKQNTNRLLRLINNLIDLTKIDAGYYQIEKGNYDIISLVEELVMSVVEYARHKAIEVVFDTEVEEAIIACDKEQMERIILNLLSNAIKYNVEGGKIEVSIGLTPLEIQISVLDTGVGIPIEQIPFIFERFIQVDNILTRKCEGSGIGLSIVKALVEMHEGTVGVTSEGGQTIFKVTLPRIQVETGEVVLPASYGGETLERCRVELSDILR